VMRGLCVVVLVFRQRFQQTDGIEALFHHIEDWI